MCTNSLSKSRRLRISLFRASLLVVLLAVLTSPAQAASWIQASGGFNGLAMDDVNQADLSWYEDSPDGFNAPDLNSGPSLILGFGHSADEKFSFGFFWEHQYARTSGLDMDVEGTLNLGADLFLGRVYFYPVRKKSFEIGVAGAMGFMVSNGHTRFTKGNVDYGKDDVYGTTWAFDGLVLFDYMIGEKTVLEVAAGYRYAKIDKFELGKREVKDENGRHVELDYSGPMVRAGVKYRFGVSTQQVTGQWR